MFRVHSPADKKWLIVYKWRSRTQIHLPTSYLLIQDVTLQWRQNEHDGLSNNQPHDCLLSVYSDADQRKHQSSASLAFVRGIHRWPVNSPHKGPVTRKMFPFDDVIMSFKVHDPRIRTYQYIYKYLRLISYYVAIWPWNTLHQWHGLLKEIGMFK